VSSNSSNELPPGWATATIGDTGQYVNGVAFKPSDWGDSGPPIVRIQNLTDPTKPLNRTNRKVESVYGVRRGDILVSWSATLGAFTWDREDALLNQHIFKVIPNGRLVDARWLYHLLRYAIAAMKKSADLHGSTMRHVNRMPFLTFPIPLAPLNEQERIVNEIDKQFTRLDAAVAELERARANLKRYRAAVLRAACEGRLVPTEAHLARADGRDYEPADVLLDRILKERRARWEADQPAKIEAAGKQPKDDRWRAKYEQPEPPDTSGLPDLPEGWVWATVDQVSLQVQYGTSAKTNEDGEGVPVLRMGNIVDGRLETGELKFLPPEHHEFPDLLLSHGDLLFNRTNSAELVGKSAVYKGQPAPCSFASYLIRVRPAAGFAPDFLAYYLNSSHGRAWIRSVVSQQVGQANVNGSKLRALRIPLPPGAEQRRIVAEVERRLSLVDELATVVEHSLKRSDRLRQAILKRAFEGNLVPQDPNDGPASVLLERIRAERGTPTHAPDSRREGRPSRKRRMPKTAASLSKRRTGVAE
jgi:type I restriction enzyme, S subunit